MRNDDFIDAIDQAVEPALLLILGGFAAYTLIHVIFWVIL